MKRFWFVIAVFVIGCGLALAAITPGLLTSDGVTGGGETATAPGLVLSGAIDAGGLPDGYATLSRSAQLNLEVGQLPALTARPPLAAADPAWLASEIAVPSASHKPTTPDKRKLVP
jgi:hypothetical protein